MGKIANALGKYAQERQAVRPPELSEADRVTLLSYNRKTGHLLNSDIATDEPGNHSMEVLKNRGTLQRLLDHKLIFPGGKLTAKGLAECERLENLIQRRKSVLDKHIKPRQQNIEDVDTDEVIIELEEEVAPTELASEAASGFNKVVPMRKEVDREILEPATIEIKEASKPLPQIDEKIFNEGKTGTISDQYTPSSAAPVIADELDFQKNGSDLSSGSDPKISFDGQRLNKNLITLLNAQSYEAEQFKMLRNNILFPAEGSAPRTILVTSSLPGEGKSFVSANLAVSIAMNINKHVLLIDSDLRKPDLHRVFGFGDVPGLSDYLTEQRTLDSLLLKTVMEKLTLLPGGSVPPNPSELASSERMSAMLEEVKHRYHDRIIVIDSPPPILAAETSYLARQVDGILLVVKYGKTPKEDIEDLMETLGSDKILGVAINYLDMPLSRRYGYGKYSRYGTYGNGRK